jgi:hypothetical protein
VYQLGYIQLIYYVELLHLYVYSNTFVKIITCRFEYQKIKNKGIDYCQDISHRWIHLVPSCFLVQSVMILNLLHTNP